MGDLVAAVLLFALQAWLVAPMFAGEFTRYRGSIESAFITDARFIVDHFPDLSWNPFWYLGFPFEWFYTPLLPALVALVGKLIGDVPHAYRIVAATGYALGPPALYLATLEVARSRTAAVFAAVGFVFIPSASYLLPGLFADASAFSGAVPPPPWRLAALVEYGEGPHVLSLSLTLLALAAAVRHVRAPSGARLAIAVLAVLAVALTNLIGVLGAAIFVGLLLASERLGGRAGARLARVSGVGMLAGLLSLGWYSLGFIRAVFAFSTPGVSEGGAAYLVLPLLLIVALVVVAWLDRRLPEGGALVIGWVLVFGGVVAAYEMAGTAIAPQPMRYALELDAAVAIGIGVTLAALLRYLAAHVDRPRALGAAIVAIFMVLGAGGWTEVRSRLAPDEGWREWSERRVALWLAEHTGPGERAYLTGDHAFWLNVFADVPQVRGGVDFAFANHWWADVAYQMNVGLDADVSVLWMQALPVRYVVVAGPRSTEVYRDWVDPGKFEGRLAVAFDESGVRIYEVAPVGDPRLVVARVADLAVPVNAIDRAALEAYVRRISSGHAPRALEQLGLGAWRADVDVAEGEAVVLRQAFDTGWRALVDGREAPVRADVIGQLQVEVPPGHHLVELDHRVHGDFLAGMAVAFLTAFVALGISVGKRLRRS